MQSSLPRYFASRVSSLLWPGVAAIDRPLIWETEAPRFLQLKQMIVIRLLSKFLQEPMFVIANVIFSHVKRAVVAKQWDIMVLLHSALV